MNKTNFIFTVLIGLNFLSCSSIKPNSSHQIMSALWMHSSAEYDALSYQAYNIGRLRLDQSFRIKTSKKRAIILDIDETVLNNTPYTVENIIKDITYDQKSWDEWIFSSSAKPLAGAKEFLDYAHKRGVEIFYVSNRSLRHVDATFENLIKMKIPAKKENLHFKNQISSKEIRRKAIFKNFNVVLFFGDNLSDFHRAYDHTGVDLRYESTQKLKKKFGKKFIVFPNTTYGDWVNTLYDYDYSKTPKQKSDIRLKHLSL